LTGVVVAVDVMRALLLRKDLRYTYRLLIVPETIGSVAYLSHHEELLPRMKGGLFFEMLGRDSPHALQLSFSGETDVDRCLELALRRHDPQGYTGAFRTVILNDEVQFNAPGVRVPMLSLSRVLKPGSPEWPYKGYHSSVDTPDALSIEALTDSRELALEMIDMLEQDLVPVNLTKGEIFCSRYGLHIDWYANPEGNRAFLDIVHLVDGTRSVAQIAKACEISFEAAKNVIDELVRHGLAAYRNRGAGREEPLA
jgi:aminopeptidase-like protein